LCSEKRAATTLRLHHKGEEKEKEREGKEQSTKSKEGERRILWVAGVEKR
jgi:hypothetical protein